MRTSLLILLFLTIASLHCVAQYIALPDSVLSSSVVSDEVVIETPEATGAPALYYDPLFREAPAVNLEDYLTSPIHAQSLFYDLPELPSEFFIHMLVLHLSKADVPGLEEEMAMYNLMLENFTKNLYEGGSYSVPYVPAVYGDTHSSTFVTAGGGATLYSGTLDPLEAYRKWVQDRRLMRARSIIKELEAPTMTSQPEVSPSSVTLPGNLLQENNYDVKVKKDGDNPPYRP